MAENPREILTRLTGHLVRLGFSSPQIAAVTSDVDIRLRAILCRWSNEPLRRTLLFHGVEESTFYDPARGDPDARALVVVGIRNSLLEDFASTTEAARRWGAAAPLVSDRNIREITSDLLACMVGLDLAALAERVGAPPHDLDPFADLSARYPLAWKAMSEAASMVGHAKVYDPLPAGHDSILPDSSPTATSGSTFVSAAVSGIDARIDQGLAQGMRDTVEGGLPFMGFSGFRGCSRNPDKLYRVMNDLMNHDLAFVTPNYFLSNGYVARRQALLRPCHTDPEFLAQIADHSGLKPRHREALDAMA